MKHSVKWNRIEQFDTHFVIYVSVSEQDKHKKQKVLATDIIKNICYFCTLLLLEIQSIAIFHTLAYSLMWSDYRQRRIDTC